MAAIEEVVEETPAVATTFESLVRLLRFLISNESRHLIDLNRV